MQVSEDFICEHEMPQPWVTCTECMMLPKDEQPEPPKPKPVVKPAPVRKHAGSKNASSAGGRSTASRAPKAPSTRLPRHADDTRPELAGSYDMSYEVPDENVTFHVRGSDSTWLALSAFPIHLRANGWVYLQVDGDVVARSRVKSIGYRDKRWTQEPTATTSDIGGGPTLELHEDSWERLRVWLGPEAERQTAGFRYLVTNDIVSGDAAVRIADVD